MQKVQINNGNSYEIRTTKEETKVDGASLSFDIKQTGEGKFHILSGNKSFKAYSKKLSENEFEVVVNGNSYVITVKDEKALLLEKLGLGYATANKADNVKAPMPGMVLEIMVKEGETVKKGDPLLILEAMKMENVIKAPADVEVKNVHVDVKQAVEKNQVLISF